MFIVVDFASSHVEQLSLPFSIGEMLAELLPHVSDIFFHIAQVQSCVSCLYVMQERVCHSKWPLYKSDIHGT